MEKTIKLKTPDGYTLYGTLNTARRKAKALVVFVHGLTGYQNEHQFYNAARFFPQREFDVFRFDLYSDEKGGRVLTKSTLRTHAADVNTTLQHFRKRYNKIHVVGHSLGGPTILLSDTTLIDSIVLWDPAHNLHDSLTKSLKFSKPLRTYILRWGVEYLLGKRMRDEWMAFDARKANALIARIRVPIKIICAGKGILVRGGKQYFKYANRPKAFTVIKSAGHTFSEGETERDLFRETLVWIRKHN